MGLNVRVWLTVAGIQYQEPALLSTVYQIRTLSAVLCCYIRVHVLKGNIQSRLRRLQIMAGLWCCSLQHVIGNKNLLTRRFCKRKEAATPMSNGADEEDSSEESRCKASIVARVKKVLRWHSYLDYFFRVSLQTIKSEDGGGGNVWLVWAIGCILHSPHNKIESSANLRGRILYMRPLHPLQKNLQLLARVVKKINAYSWIFHFFTGWLRRIFH